MPIALNKSDLAGFHGSENWFRHTLNRRFLYTDGVKYVADQGGAYWLIDEIALANLFNARVKAEEFQVWTLKLSATDSSAELVCDDGNDVFIFSKHIPLTDFPADSVTFYFENETLCLPSER